MSESMLDFLANVLRIYLPYYACLCNAHMLPKGKTGEVLLRKHDQKSLYIFPYRTRSKYWVMFILRKEDDAHTLHILHPRETDLTALEWATKHFMFKFTLKTAPERIQATNTDGFDLAIVASLLAWVYTDTTIATKHRVEHFLLQAPETLQEVRAAAISASEADLEYVFMRNATLKAKFQGIFETLVHAPTKPPPTQRISNKDVEKARTRVRRQDAASPSRESPHVPAGLDGARGRSTYTAHTQQGRAHG